MNNNTLDALATLLSVALGKHEIAKNNSDVPMQHADADEIAKGNGIKKWSDNLPAEQMMPKVDPGSKVKPLDMEWFEIDPEEALAAYESQWRDQLAYKTEVDGRREPLAEGRKDKSRRRMAASRARQKRAQQFEKADKSPEKPNPERLSMAWEVMVPLDKIIANICRSKGQWAARHLGTIASGDVPSMVMEAMVLMIAKSDQDLPTLIVAAQEIGGERKRTGMIPGHQPTDEERKEGRRVTMAKKWLLSAANNYVMNTYADLYRAAENVRFENIDKIDTIMANINGVGEDPMVSRHKADRAPAMLGSRWQEPGTINRDALAMAIAGAITDRGLDALTELLIDEENLRTDGAFRWTDLAEQVFLSTDDGEHKWELICMATEGSIDPRIARAVAARKYVRAQFAFLPSLIVDAVRSFDLVSLGSNYYDGQIRATVRSEFDYFADRTPFRPLQAKLSYATPEEAARAIVENLSILITGEDIVNSMVNA